MTILPYSVHQSQENLTHYLTLALVEAGVYVSPDMRSEMADIIEHLFDYISSLEKRIDALEKNAPSHFHAAGFTLPTPTLTPVTPMFERHEDVYPAEDTDDDTDYAALYPAPAAPTAPRDIAPDADNDRPQYAAADAAITLTTTQHLLLMTIEVEPLPSVFGPYLAPDSEQSLFELEDIGYVLHDTRLRKYTITDAGKRALEVK